jgi:hypothetical protein
MILDPYDDIDHQVGRRGYKREPVGSLLGTWESPSEKRESEPAGEERIPKGRFSGETLD